MNTVTMSTGRNIRYRKITQTAPKKRRGVNQYSGITTSSRIKKMKGNKETSRIAKITRK